MKPGRLKLQNSAHKAAGYTIIEILIVLAIAGLILTLVILAIPQLQRNARDSSRKNLVNSIKSDMEDYAANNEGVYPFNPTYDPAYSTGDWEDFYVHYITAKSIDVTDPLTGLAIVNNAPSATPTGTGFDSYPFSAVALDQSKLPNKTGAFAIIRGAACSGENVVASGSSASFSVRHYALVISLDNSATRYCTDNS